MKSLAMRVPMKDPKEFVFELSAVVKPDPDRVEKEASSINKRLA